MLAVCPEDMAFADNVIVGAQDFLLLRMRELGGVNIKEGIFHVIILIEEVLKVVEAVVANGCGGLNREHEVFFTNPSSSLTITHLTHILELPK